jgi:hypothetical protein
MAGVRVITTTQDAVFVADGHTRVYAGRLGRADNTMGKPNGEMHLKHIVTVYLAQNDGNFWQILERISGGLRADA